MNVERVKLAVSKLSALELARFSKWLFTADQIGTDLCAGRRADDHYESGCCRPLDLRSGKTKTSKEQMTSKDWDDFESHIKEIRTR